MDSIEKKAIYHLKVAIKNDPQHLPSIVKLCEILVKKKSFSEAQKILNDALSNTNNVSSFYFLQAKLYFETQNYEEAIVFIDKAIQCDSNEVRFYKLAHKTLVQSRKENQAIPYLEKLVDLCPLDGESHYSLSQLLNDETEIRRKILLLEISIELLPCDIKPIIDLARIYMEQTTRNDHEENSISATNLKKAEKLFVSATKIKSGSGLPWYYLGKLTHSRKQFKRASTNFSKAHKYKETKGKSAYHLAIINLHYKKNKEAEKYFFEALSLDVKKSNCLLYIAEICSLKKEYKRAITHLKTASEIVVLEEQHEYTASNLYCEASNFVLARKHLKNAFKKKKLRSKIIIKNYQINKLLKIHQNEEVILRAAIKLNPDYFESYFELGLHFIKEKRIEDAQRMFTKACHNNWEHCESHFELGKIEFNLKNTSKAKMHFKIVLDLNNNHSEASRMIERIT